MVHHNKNFGTKLKDELNICSHFALFICILLLYCLYAFLISSQDISV